MREIRTTVMGNATKAPSIMRGGAEPFSVQLRIAVTGRYFDQEAGGYEDRRTEYFSVFVRKEAARHVLASVKKGDPVIVTGRLHTSEWTTETGETRRDLTIQAEHVGHDLTFGTSRFTRSSRPDEVDADEVTGEILEGAEHAPGSSSTLLDPASTDDSADRALVAG